MIRWMMVFLVCSCTVALSQSERSLVSDGNRSYRQNKFNDAEIDYRKALQENRDSKVGVFNLGDALYKQGRFGEAAEQYALVASNAKDPALKAQAYHNLGNALLKGQKIPESIAAYKEALKTSPKDFDTKYNYELAKSMLRQQQQQQQQQQNKQDKQNQKDKQQDKNKQDQKQQDQQQQQNQQNQQQDQQKSQQDKTQAQQSKKQQISKEDAERILAQLKNEEMNVQKKLHKKLPARIRVEKDW